MWAAPDGAALLFSRAGLEILKLREGEGGARGEFAIRQFRDLWLHGGAVPLAILDKVVDNYITAKQTARWAGKAPRQSGARYRARSVLWFAQATAVLRAGASTKPASRSTTARTTCSQWSAMFIAIMPKIRFPGRKKPMTARTA